MSYERKAFISVSSTSFESAVSDAIAASKSNPILSQKIDYITSLEQIHQESLANAPEEAKIAYRKAKFLLES